MKKLITGLMIASLLALGLASAAMAQVTNASLSNTYFGSLSTGTNATSTSIAGIGNVSVFRPLTVATTVTTAALGTTALGTRTANITFTPPSNAVVFPDHPELANSQMNATQWETIVSRIQNFVGYTGVNTSRSAAMTTAISSNTAYAARVNTALFDNLFTPPPAVLSTTAGQYGMTVYPVPGNTMNSYAISQLEVWKFLPAITGWKTQDAVKYSLASTTSDITGTTDGQVWFTTDPQGTAASLMGSASTFANNGSSTYYMWVVLKDNGNFDMDYTPGVILDPPTVTPATSTSSSSSGCVYNPAAGLSLDLLFLALPALGVLASRIRRK